MPPTASPMRQSPLRRLFLLVLMVLAGLTLTGCGAVVDTALVINADGSGSRTITATIDSSELKQIPGGKAALEKAVKTALPAGMRYDGISGGNLRDATVTFVVPFASIDDYRGKATAILAAGGKGPADITYTKGAAPFADGVTFSENFTSQDLLAWLIQALINDGKLTAASGQSLLKTGTASLALPGGKSRIGMKEPLADSTMTERGFSEITVTTSGLLTGEYENVVAYTLKRADYQRQQRAYDDWFTSVVPAGAQLTTSADNNQHWTVRLKASTTEELVTATQALLGGEALQLNVAAPERVVPLQARAEVSMKTSCSAICNRGVVPKSVIAIPQGWQVAGHDVSDGQAAVAPDEKLVLTRNVALESLSAVLTVTAVDTALDLKIALPVDLEIEERAQIEHWFRSRPGAGSITVDPGSTSYLVRFASSDPNELATQIQAFFSTEGAQIPMPSFLVAQERQTLIKTTSSAQIDLDLRPALGNGNKPTTVQVKLPFFAQVVQVNDGHADIQRHEFMVETPANQPISVRYGMTEYRMQTLVAAASILVLLLLAGVLLLTWHRRGAAKPKTEALAESLAEQAQTSKVWTPVPPPAQRLVAPRLPVPPNPHVEPVSSQPTALMPTLPTATIWDSNKAED